MPCSTHTASQTLSRRGLITHNPGAARESGYRAKGCRVCLHLHNHLWFVIPAPLKSPPRSRHTTSVRHPGTASHAPRLSMQQQPPYVLIGSEHSLYTGKLRAYLIWRGIPFKEFTASAEVYKHIILPRTGVAFIPVLVLPDRTTVLQDTHAIIQHLEHQLTQQQQGQAAASMRQQQLQPYPMAAAPLQPRSPKLAAASQLLQLYGDEWLVLPAMHYRWSFPQQRQRLLYQFGSTNMPTGSYTQQMAAGAKVAARFEGMLPGLGITAASIPTIEARFRWQLAVLQEHFQHHSYLLSSLQPCGADFAFTGPLLAHLYIDPVPSCLLRCSAPLVADYIERLSGMHSHARVVDRLLQHSTGTAPAPAAPPAARWSVGSSTACCSAGAVSATAQSEAVQASGIVAGLQPEDLQRPGQGQLKTQLLHLLPAAGQQQQPHQQLQQQKQEQQQEQKQEQQQYGGDAGSAATDCMVPHAALLLLHHMFLEQVPVILSTLELLKAWVRQQQQQQPSEQQHSGGSSSGSEGSSEGWLVVPRFLGKHSFTLFDPASGQPVQPHAAGGYNPLQRVASSYVAWRAAEIVRWYQQLPPADRAAVRQLLQEVSAVDAVCGGSSSRGVASSGSAHQPPQPPTVDNSSKSTAAGGQAVDAAGAFERMVQLVGECGCIARRNNRVVVCCDMLPGAGQTLSKL